MGSLWIEPRFCLLCAALLLVLPLPWCMAVFAAALFHELCHLAAVVLLRGRIGQVRLDIGGAQIQAQMPDNVTQILAILAGPAGSLLLMGLCRRLPRIAICGCIQGVYNLLPVFPLDGGRALRGILGQLWPEKADIVCSLTQNVTLILLFAAAVYASVVLCMGFWPLLTVLALISGRLNRKIPCKRCKIGVQ